MSEYLLHIDGFGGDIAGKIVLLGDPGAAIIHAMRDGVRFRLSANFFSDDTGRPDDAVQFVLVPEPARQTDGRDAEIARLTAEVERHRMTERERKAVACAAGQEELLATVNDDDVSKWHTDRALMLRALLDRTAPKEA